jgi:hypothetical protein
MFNGRIYVTANIANAATETLTHVQINELKRKVYINDWLWGQVT